MGCRDSCINSNGNEENSKTDDNGLMIFKTFFKTSPQTHFDKDEEKARMLLRRNSWPNGRALDVAWTAYEENNHMNRSLDMEWDVAGLRRLEEVYFKNELSFCEHNIELDMERAYGFKDQDDSFHEEATYLSDLSTEVKENASKLMSKSSITHRRNTEEKETFEIYDQDYNMEFRSRSLSTSPNNNTYKSSNHSKFEKEEIKERNNEQININNNCNIEHDLDIASEIRNQNLLGLGSEQGFKSDDDFDSQNPIININNYNEDKHDFDQDNKNVNYHLNIVESIEKLKSIEKNNSDIDAQELNQHPMEQIQIQIQKDQDPIQIHPSTLEKLDSDLDDQPKRERESESEGYEDLFNLDEIEIIRNRGKSLEQVFTNEKY